MDGGVEAARNDGAEARKADGEEGVGGQVRGGAGQVASLEEQQLRHGQEVANAGANGNIPEQTAQAMQGFDPQRPQSSVDRQQLQQPRQQD